ncbi:MAG: NUDIX domain-containing protein [Bacteroidales bacterium]
MHSRNYLVPLHKGRTEVDFHLSVDCVIFSIRDKNLHLLLNRMEPVRKWMLPGGFMFRNEDADQAAGRILKLRTGVERVYLNQFKIFSDPRRFSFHEETRKFPLTPEEDALLEHLPDRVISIGYFALVDFQSVTVTGGDFREETCWCPLESLPEMEFDHAEIVGEALRALRKEVQFSPILYRLLPEKFTLPELQNLYEIVLGRPLERSAFQRKVLRWGIFLRLDERKEGVAHKRPYLYRFEAEAFRMARENGRSFGM